VSHKRIQWVDELRGLAALLILLAHYRHFLSDVPLEFYLLDITSRGVQLFYILSGYILYSIYRNRLANAKSIFEFYVRRWFRIAPLFYTVCIISLLLFFPSIRNPLVNFSLHLLILPFGMYPEYINGIIGPEWSVYVEFWFYMAFPVLLWLFTRYGVILFGIALLLSFSQTIYFYLTEPDISIRTFWYNQPTAQLVFFIGGMLVLRAREVLVTKWRKFISWSSIALLAILGVCIRYFSVQLFLSLPLLIMLVIGYADISKAEWVSRSLAHAGKISFSLYLFHIPIGNIVEYWIGLNGIHGWVACMISVYVLSMISYNYIEKTGIELGRKFISQHAKMKSSG